MKDSIADDDTALIACRMGKLKNSVDVTCSVDVLVIVVPDDAYSIAELDAIETWVKGGGRLLLITDRQSFSVQANTIAARFGITLAEDIIYDTNENVNGIDYWPYFDGWKLLSHPITNGVSRVEMYACDGILTAPANEVPLIVTDIDGTAHWFDLSPAIGVSVMSAFEGDTVGSGRLVVVTDSSLWKDTDTDGGGQMNFYDSDHEVLALNTIEWLSPDLSPQQELSYDDGTAEWGGTWVLAGGMYAVRFTPPVSGQLTNCRFYITSDPETIMVHVLDANKSDLITPFSATPTSTGWFDVDLSAYGIPVSNGVDFYVAMESTTAWAPFLGIDTDSPDNRSWKYNLVDWELYTDGDYMIRSTIERCTDLVVTDVYLDPADPMAEGTEVTFYADVDNQGDLDANDFVVQVYLDGELFLEAEKSIAAGVGFTYWNSLPWDAVYGNHTIRWVIDATNVIVETNETNNEMSRTFTVGEHLTVESACGVTAGEGWYDRNATAYAALDVGVVDYGNGTRRVFTHWSGDASGTNYTQSDPIYMDESKTATANWKTQYYLTVESAYGTVGGEGWYDVGSNVYATLDAGVVDHGNGTRRTFTQWNGDASGTNYAQSDPILMDEAKTATADWKTQHYLTMNTDVGTVSPSSGWYDEGTTVQIGTSDQTSTASEQYTWLGWTGTGTGSYTGTDKTTTITMNSPITETASWKHEYYLTVTSPCGSPSPSNCWVEAGRSITV